MDSRLLPIPLRQCKQRKSAGIQGVFDGILQAKNCQSENSGDEQVFRVSRQGTIAAKSSKSSTEELLGECNQQRRL